MSDIGIALGGVLFALGGALTVALALVLALVGGAWVRSTARGRPGNVRRVLGSSGAPFFVGVSAFGLGMIGGRVGETLDALWLAPPLVGVCAWIGFFVAMAPPDPPGETE